MRIAFVRHGERRKNEIDPELTSFGFRMVEETGQWLLDMSSLPISYCRHHQSHTANCSQHLGTFSTDFYRTDRACSGNPGRLEALDAVSTNRNPVPNNVLLVGHHPTMEMLIQCYGPAPVVVSRHQFAVGLILQTAPETSWVLTHAWPGRTS